MPQLKKIELRPGVNTQLTPTANEGGWSESNLIRWKDGLLEKLGGWQRLFDTAAAGVVRCMHAYEDLSRASNLALGTDGGPQVYANGILNDIVFLDGTIDYVGQTSIVVLGIGSATYEVFQAAHGYSNGDLKYISTTMFLGGFIFYPQTVTVAVIDADHWTFDWEVATAGGAGAAPLFSATGPTYTFNVHLKSHGLVAGDSFDVQYDAQFSVSPNAVTYVPSGSYEVVSVVDVDNFTITSAVAAPAGTTSNLPERPLSTLSSGTYWIPIQGVAADPSPPQNWFLDNLGQNLIITFTNGSLYVRLPGQNTAALISTAPLVNAGAFVAMPQAQVITFGASVGVNQDPLLVAFSDAGTYDEWTASATNQAGTFRLSRGSKIIAGFQAPQTTLLITDIDAWSMSYVGPPFVYSFNVIASGCGIVAPRAWCILGGTSYWLSQKGFFRFQGSGVVPFPCAVWDVLFNDIDTDNAYKIFLAPNSSFNEFSVFYPSIDGNGEIDSYVKVNVESNLWDYGSLVRTAWLDQSIFGPALGADGAFHIQQHELGYDDNNVAMDGVFAQSGYFDIGDGADILFVDQFISDFKWFGSNGYVALTLYATAYPGQQPIVYGPYNLTSVTRQIPLRARARQIAYRLEWAPELGFSARFGAPSVRVAPAGSRP